MTAALKRDKPLYISDHCECGTQLMLFDSWTDPPTTDENEIWYDEWICPSCIETNPKDGIRMDWSEERQIEFKINVETTLQHLEIQENSRKRTQN